jgi:hypothetical protein
MSSRLGQRITRIEHQTGQARKMYVFEAPDGMSTDDAVAALGISPGEQDSLVQIRLFDGGAPKLISVMKLQG